jgi:hypothetical protein
MEDVLINPRIKPEPEYPFVAFMRDCAVVMRDCQLAENAEFCRRAIDKRLKEFYPNNRERAYKVYRFQLINAWIANHMERLVQLGLANQSKGKPPQIKHEIFLAAHKVFTVPDEELNPSILPIEMAEHVKELTDDDWNKANEDLHNAGGD